jgi:deazaflavin-dependent oxidoreductase (nitroreductase family)
MDEEARLDAEAELERSLRLSPDVLRRIFRLGNKFMVGLFRAGLGPYVSNPYSGYIMVLTTTGRKTGLRRRTPVNFAMGDGEVYCLSGFGRRSDWYRNIVADPAVDVWMGGEGWRGEAEVMTDPEEWLPVYRRILARSGFADGLFTKVRWSDLNDEDLLRMGSAAPAVRIRLREPLPAREGPGDLAWLWPRLAGALFAVWLVRRRLGRR